MLEALIAAAALALLASLAIPSWQDYRARAERSEARAWLIRLTNSQEDHFIRHGHYADTLQSLGFAAGVTRTPGGQYELSLHDVTPAGFQVRATRIAEDREASRCGWFQLDQTQTRRSGPEGLDVCWWR